MDDVPADAADGARGTNDDTTRETTYSTICGSRDHTGISKLHLVVSAF